MGPAELYETLMGLCDEAFAAGRFEVAYHLLEAAAHGAHEARDERRLARVAADARRRQAWLDANRPGHRMASPQARHRGNTPLFESCARAAEVMLAGLRAEAATRKALEAARE